MSILLIWVIKKGNYGFMKIGFMKNKFINLRKLLLKKE